MQMTEDEVAALIKKCKEEGKTEEKFVRASFHRPTSFRPRKHPALPPFATHAARAARAARAPRRYIESGSTRAAAGDFRRFQENNEAVVGTNGWSMFIKETGMETARLL